MLELLLTECCAICHFHCCCELGNLQTDQMINSNNKYQHLQSFSTQMAPSTIQKSAIYIHTKDQQDMYMSQQLQRTAHFRIQASTNIDLRFLF